MKANQRLQHDVSRSPNPQGGTNCSTSTSTNDNWQQHGRKLLKPEEVIGLHPRVAITFTPGRPPISTWLTRYYENDFGAPAGLSPAKMIFDTACLFLGSLALAGMFTAAIFYHTFQ